MELVKNTAWFASCAQNDIEFVSLNFPLFVQKRDQRQAVSIVDQVIHNFTGLQYAVFFDSLDVCKLLLQHEVQLRVFETFTIYAPGISEEAKAQLVEGSSVLQIALYRGSRNCLQYLYEQMFIDENMKKQLLSVTNVNNLSNLCVSVITSSVPESFRIFSDRRILEAEWDIGGDDKNVLNYVCQLGQLPCMDFLHQYFFQYDELDVIWNKIVRQLLKRDTDDEDEPTFIQLCEVPLASYAKYNTSQAAKLVCKSKMAEMLQKALDWAVLTEQTEPLKLWSKFNFQYENQLGEKKVVKIRTKSEIESGIAVEPIEQIPLPPTVNELKLGFQEASLLVSQEKKQNKKDIDIWFSMQNIEFVKQNLSRFCRVRQKKPDCEAYLILLAVAKDKLDFVKLLFKDERLTFNPHVALFNGQEVLAESNILFWCVKFNSVNCCSFILQQEGFELLLYSSTQSGVSLLDFCIQQNNKAAHLLLKEEKLLATYAGQDLLLKIVSSKNVVALQLYEQFFATRSLSDLFYCLLLFRGDSFEMLRIDEVKTDDKTGAVVLKLIKDCIQFCYENDWIRSPKHEARVRQFANQGELEYLLGKYKQVERTLTPIPAPEPVKVPTPEPVAQLVKAASPIKEIAEPAPEPVKEPEPAEEPTVIKEATPVQIKEPTPKIQSKNVVPSVQIEAKSRNFSAALDALKSGQELQDYNIFERGDFDTRVSNFEEKVYYGVSPLFYAILGGNAKVIDILFDKFSLQLSKNEIIVKSQSGVNIQLQKGANALNFVAAYGNQSIFDHLTMKQTAKSQVSTTFLAFQSQINVSEAIVLSDLERFPDMLWQLIKFDQNGIIVNALVVDKVPKTALTKLAKEFFKVHGSQRIDDFCAQKIATIRRLKAFFLNSLVSDSNLIKETKNELVKYYQDQNIEATLKQQYTLYINSLQKGKKIIQEKPRSIFVQKVSMNAKVILGFEYLSDEAEQFLKNIIQEKLVASEVKEKAKLLDKEYLVQLDNCNNMVCRLNPILISLVNNKLESFKVLIESGFVKECILSHQLVVNSAGKSILLGINSTILHYLSITNKEMLMYLIDNNYFDLDKLFLQNDQLLSPVDLMVVTNTINLQFFEYLIIKTPILQLSRMFSNFFQNYLSPNLIDIIQTTSQFNDKAKQKYFAVLFQMQRSNDLSNNHISIILQNQYISLLKFLTNKNVDEILTNIGMSSDQIDSCKKELIDIRNEQTGQVYEFLQTQYKTQYDSFVEAIQSKNNSVIDIDSQIMQNQQNLDPTDQYYSFSCLMYALLFDNRHVMNSFINELPLKVERNINIRDQQLQIGEGALELAIILKNRTAIDIFLKKNQEYVLKQINNDNLVQKQIVNDFIVINENFYLNLMSNPNQYLEIMIKSRSEMFYKILRNKRFTYQQQQQLMIESCRLKNLFAEDQKILQYLINSILSFGDNPEFIKTCSYLLEMDLAPMRSLFSSDNLINSVSILVDPFQYKFKLLSSQFEICTERPNGNVEKCQQVFDLKQSLNIDVQLLEFRDQRKYDDKHGVYPGFAPIHYCVVMNNSALLEQIFQHSWDVRSTDEVIINGVYIAKGTNCLLLAMLLNKQAIALNILLNLRNQISKNKQYLLFSDNQAGLGPLGALAFAPGILSSIVQNQCIREFLSISINALKPVTNVLTQIVKCRNWRLVEPLQSSFVSEKILRNYYEQVLVARPEELIQTIQRYGTDKVTVFTTAFALACYTDALYFGAKRRIFRTQIAELFGKEVDQFYAAARANQLKLSRNKIQLEVDGTEMIDFAAELMDKPLHERAIYVSQQNAKLWERIQMAARKLDKEFI